VGLGKVAELAHLPALGNFPGLRVVAVADPLPERRARARVLLPESRVYPDLKSLLARESGLDFLDISTPPGGRVDLVETALRRGLHVLCEKPLALAPEEFARLREASARSGAALVTVNNWRYAPLLNLSRQLVRAGAIGQVHHVEWEVYRTTASGGGLTAWRQDPAHALGGILVDHGWHAFYLLMDWGGGVPQSLRAHLQYDAAPPGVEVEAEVEVVLPRATGRLFLTWRAPERENRGRLTGTAGEIILADDRLSRIAFGFAIEEQTFPEKLSGGSHHPEWMAGVFSEFLEEIQDPAKRGRNFSEAANCAGLIGLAYRSQAAGGAWLDFAAA
jgi:predicted dehydrogenase